jgi:hypothetical protein
VVAVIIVMTEARLVQDDSKWGGEIELYILSQHYRVEIVAVEIRTLHCYCYGETANHVHGCYSDQPHDVISL